MKRGTLDIQPDPANEKYQRLFWKYCLPDREVSVQFRMFSDSCRRVDLNLGGPAGLEELCAAGAAIARQNDEIEQQRYDNWLLLIKLNMRVLPRFQEFRKRQHRRITNIQRAGDGIAFLPGNFHEREDSKDPSTSRRLSLERLWEMVFPDKPDHFLRSACLYFLEGFDTRYDESRVKQMIRSSLVSLPLTDEDIDTAYTYGGPITERVLGKIITKYDSEEDDTKVNEWLDSFLRSTFATTVKAKKGGGPLDYDESRKMFLALCVDSFWHLAEMYRVVFRRIRECLRVDLRFNNLELKRFDTMYMAQDFLAGLQPAVLWPRVNMVFPMIFTSVGSDGWEECLQKQPTVYPSPSTGRILG